MPDQLNGPRQGNDPAPPDDLASLSEWIDGLIQGFQDHPDEDVRQRVFALLDGIDALHRASLGRLVSILEAPGAELVWARAREDQLVRTVLLLYELMPATEQRSRKPVIPLRMVERAPPPRVPEWFDVAVLSEVAPGVLRGVRVAGEAVLICTMAGDIFAYHDACPDTPLALSLGQLDGEQIVCPWHGCRFDVRTGERLEHRGTGLDALPVEVEGNRVRVGLNNGPPSR